MLFFLIEQVTLESQITSRLTSLNSNSTLAGPGGPLGHYDTPRRVLQGLNQQLTSPCGQVNLNKKVSDEKKVAKNSSDIVEMKWKKSDVEVDGYLMMQRVSYQFLKPNGLHINLFDLIVLILKLYKY